jgi:hypothetical protein
LRGPGFGKVAVIVPPALRQVRELAANLIRVPELLGIRPHLLATGIGQ